MEPTVTIRRAPRRRSTHGLTLVETLVAVTVLGVILAVAAPSLRDLMERRRVIAAATELASMINYAKAEAAKQRGGGSDNGFTLHLEPPDDASTSCARLTTNSVGDTCGCDVAKADVCVNSTSSIIREFVLDRDTGVSFEAAADDWGDSNRAITFQRNNYFGFVKNLRLTATGRHSGAQLRVEFNSVGRVHICSPSNTIGGYPSCG